MNQAEVAEVDGSGSRLGDKNNTQNLKVMKKEDNCHNGMKRPKVADGGTPTVFWLSGGIISLNCSV